MRVHQAQTRQGRCFRAVDAMLDGSPKLIAIDAQPNHQGVPRLCLRKADRPAYQPLDPRAHVDMLALDLLGVGLPHRVLLGCYMPLVGTPAVRKIAHDAKGLQQRFELQKDRGLPSSKHIRSHRARVVLNGGPEPARMGCAPDGAPHFVELGTEPPMYLQCIRTPYFHLNLLGMEGQQHAVMHGLQVRRLFF